MLASWRTEVTRRRCAAPWPDCAELLIVPEPVLPLAVVPLVEPDVEPVPEPLVVVPDPPPYALDPLPYALDPPVESIEPRISTRELMYCCRSL